MVSPFSVGSVAVWTRSPSFRSRGLLERGTGDQGARDLVVVVDGDQGPLVARSSVVLAAVAERGVVVDAQRVGPAVEGLEPGVEDHRAAVGVGHDLLRDPVPALEVGAHLGEPQAALVRAGHHRAHARALLVGGRAVVDGQLEAAHAGRRQVGVEDLADPTGLEREPHPALAGASRAEPRLVGLCPALLVRGVGRLLRPLRSTRAGPRQGAPRQRQHDCENPRTSFHAGRVPRSRNPIRAPSDGGDAGPVPEMECSER